jgi:hypothetical protein
LVIYKHRIQQYLELLWRVFIKPSRKAVATLGANREGGLEINAGRATFTLYLAINVQEKITIRV